MTKFKVEGQFPNRKITKIQVHESRIGSAGFILQQINVKHCYSIIHLEGNEKIVLEASPKSQPQKCYLINVKPYNHQEFAQRQIGKIFEHTLRNTYKTLRDLGNRLRQKFHNQQYSLLFFNCYYVSMQILKQLQLMHLKKQLKQYFSSYFQKARQKAFQIGRYVWDKRFDFFQGSLIDGFLCILSIEVVIAVVVVLISKVLDYQNNQQA